MAAVGVLVGVSLAGFKLEAASVAKFSATLVSQRLGSYQSPGTAPPLSWPSGVEASIAIPAVGGTPVASSPSQAPEPIASLAKLMTAYLTLEKHPLSPGKEGPKLVMSSQDVAIYNRDVSEDQSSVQVKVGEVLDEKELLEAMLVRSANNIASVLGRWDAGSSQAFVAEMNAAAARFKMVGAHFTDASGFLSSTVATASDVALIADRDMKIPAFPTLADQASVTLPHVGKLPNIVGRIGTGAVVGIKSGYTIWSGGCAAIATVDSTPAGKLTVVGVVVGQQSADAISRAADAAQDLAEEAGAYVRDQAVLQKGAIVGDVVVPWSKHRPLRLITTKAVTVPLWPGERVSRSVDLATRSVRSLHDSSVVGEVVVTTPAGVIRVSVQVAGGSVVPPNLWWRMTH